jgi:lysophospholipase L1-like esterase
MTISRREFVAATGAGVALACAGTVHIGAEPARDLPRGATILFQGDSITDTGRDRVHAAPNVASALGNGYPLLLAATLLRANPELGLRVYNRGVSGNTVPDLTARWETDTLALRPDLLSLLIGVNDYWHTRTSGYTGTVADYETQFGALLDETTRRLPTTRIVVLEPFVLRTGAVDASWFPEFDTRRAVAARVAARAGATFIPLQRAFDDAAMKGGPAYWLADGVHPTPAGHALIAERWRTLVTGIPRPAS